MTDEMQKLLTTLRSIQIPFGGQYVQLLRQAADVIESFDTRITKLEAKTDGNLGQHG